MHVKNSIMCKHHDRNAAPFVMRVPDLISKCKNFKCRSEECCKSSLTERSNKHIIKCKIFKCRPEECCKSSLTLVPTAACMWKTAANMLYRLWCVSWMKNSVEHSSCDSAFQRQQVRSSENSPLNLERSSKNYNAGSEKPLPSVKNAWMR